MVTNNSNICDRKILFFYGFSINHTNNQSKFIPRWIVALRYLSIGSGHEFSGYNLMSEK